MYACFFVPLVNCTCICYAAAVEPRSPPRRCRADPVYRPCWPVLPVYCRMTRSHVVGVLFWKRSRELFTFTSDFVEWRSTMLWILERRRARSSCSVCCEGSFDDSRWERGWVTEWYNWRNPGASPLSHSTSFLPHRDTAVSCLTNDTLTIQFKYWLLWRLTPDMTDRSPPVLRHQQSVSSLSSITPLPRRVCCLPLATSFRWHSRLYTML